DSPVFTSATLSGNTLTLAGYVGSAASQSTFANATVDFYVSDNSSANGAGQTWLGTLTADASGNFSGTLTGVAGLTAGSSRLTGVATDGSGNSSEFGVNYLVAKVGIAGTVFEDVNYGGGAGRSLAASSGAPVSGARVELFDSSGAYVSATSTAVDGSYSFSALNPSTNYHVRVVSSSVLSTRSGASASLLGVQTYRTSTSAGVVSAVTDFVGGTNPAVADSGNAGAGISLNTSTYVFSGMSGTAHAVAPVGVGTSGATGVDFGFNFSTVVNTNDSGPGSLRQAITNANTLGGDASLAQVGRTAAVDNIVFMLPNGTTGSGGSLGLAAGGLRAALNTFSGGVATLSPATALPTVSTAMVIDAQAQPGWTAAANAPVVKIAATAGSLAGNGFTVSAGATVRGFSIVGFSSSAGVSITGAGATVQGSWIGLTEAGTRAIRATP
ncbi:MAG: hypothetical protein LW854_23850, partial [Rubrivivax sp.]|nr:hypothetical protein [Rubrivivax sp.]